MTDAINVDLTHRAQLTHRPRRNRRQAAVRKLIQEHRLHATDFVHAYFVIEGTDRVEPVDSMPGQARLSIDRLIADATELWNMGLRAIDIFVAIDDELKDPYGTEALNPDGLLQRSIRALKQALPDLWIMADVALDPFTSHGHDGVLNSEGDVDNDASLHVLGRMALSAAEAGVDMVAPSDMMDGRIEHIRSTLDANGFTHVGILSYAAKYCSALYGPFRDALASAPKSGDKKTYQMNPANVREAQWEAYLDELEGADMLLVKPGLPYLDVLAKIREQSQLPIAAYQVSGEYAMVKAAAEKGWLKADEVLYECLLSMKRAGADFILGYAFRDVAHLLD